MDEYDRLKELGIGFPPCFSEVPDGWHNLFAETLKKCKEAGWDGHGLAQFKEKFGRLRIYIDFHKNDEEVAKLVQTILDEAEELSALVCQDCGELGEHLKNRAWWLTLCPACVEKRDNANKKNKRSVP